MEIFPLVQQHVNITGPVFTVKENEGTYIFNTWIPPAELANKLDQCQESRMQDIAVRYWGFNGWQPIRSRYPLPLADLYNRDRASRRYPSTVSECSEGIEKPSNEVSGCDDSAGQDSLEQVKRHKRPQPWRHDVVSDPRMMGVLFPW